MMPPMHQDRCIRSTLRMADQRSVWPGFGLISAVKAQLAGTTGACAHAGCSNQTIRDDAAGKLHRVTAARLIRGSHMRSASAFPSYWRVSCVDASREAANTA
jgi:hypothetical protein